MSEQIFSVGLFSGIRVLLVAILMYVLIYAILQKIKVLGDDKRVNSLIALTSAIIVSFSGIVTYAITYAINWFVIVLFIVFLLMFTLMFLGVNSSAISEQASKRPVVMIIVGLFVILLVIVFVQGLIQANQDRAQANALIEGDPDSAFVESSRIFSLDRVDRDLLSAVGFLVLIGSVVILLGRTGK